MKYLFVFHLGIVFILLQTSLLAQNNELDFEQKYFSDTLPDSIKLQISINALSNKDSLLYDDKIWLLKNVGDIYRQMSVYDTAKYFYDIGLESAEIASDQIALKWFYIRLGYLYNEIGHGGVALEFFTKALHTNKADLNDSAIVFNSIGNAYSSMGNNSGALNYYFDALVLFEQLGDIEGVAAVDNNIGMVYDSQEDYDKAIEYYERSIAYYDSLNAYAEYARGLGNLGIVYYSLADFDRAIYYFSRALDIITLHGSKKDKAPIYNNLGNLFIDMGEIDRAREEYLKALDVHNEFNDTRGKLIVFANLASSYADEDKHLALDYYLTSLQLARELETDKYISTLFYDISELYNELGNLRLSHDYLKEYVDIMERMYEEEINKEVSKIELEFNFQEKERKLQQEKQTAVFQKDLNEQKHRETLLLLGIILISVIILVGLLAYYNRKLILKERTLEQKNKEIEKQQEILNLNLAETQAILDNSIVGILLISAHRKVIRANKRFCDLSGYTSRELLNSDTSLFFKNKLLYEEFGLYYKTMANTNEIFHFEGDFLKKNGEIRLCHVSGRALDKNNIEHGFIWIVDDITDAKRDKQQLNIYEKFIESSSQGMAIANMDLETIYVNPYLANIHRLKSEEDYANRSFLSSYPVEIKAMIQNVIIPQVLQRGKWRGELEQISPDGKTIQTLESIHLIRDENNEPLYFANIITNITPLKEIEKELVEANRTKSQMLSIIGHDLRGPVGTTTAMLDTIIDQLDEFDKKELRYILVEIKNSSSHTYNLLENLLYWARSQRGEIAFEPTEIDISSLVNQTAGLYTEILHQKDIHLIENVEESSVIYADYNMIYTILRNLISNAIKFTNPGKSIEVRLITKRNVVELRIRDEGIGMEHDVLTKIFDEKEHFTSLGTEREKGTGLGLKLCKKFVEYHEGYLTVESKVGEGSTFIVELPQTKHNKA